MKNETRADVSFELDDNNKLNVRVDTERLTLESVTAEDAKTYYDNLWSDRSVMELYATGSTQNLQYAKERVDTWVERYKKNDAFSSLTVRKNDDDSFVGQVVAGYGEQVGQSELAYLFAKKNWKQGYGSEAVGAVVNSWVAEVVQRDYRVNKKSDNPKGEKFTSIFAVARPDNPASVRILENTCKMHKYDEQEKFGHSRNYYKKDITSSR
ncbi:GNAT family N-acetyltransferase [Wolbachia endosymbiont of Folsomia candida]|uniref:GNAT family N-acetyltransferase n=1 Tax=Wolbachia endosymbiont of Folsomia candida TaxID=169402 RepID=UPI0013903750|nr:GNAT family N-acetyltransferase [Wolbachia endosymbiont of Folsomia candida]